MKTYIRDSAHTYHVIARDKVTGMDKIQDVIADFIDTTTKTIDTLRGATQFEVVDATDIIEYLRKCKQEDRNTIYECNLLINYSLYLGGDLITYIFADGVVQAVWIAQQYLKQHINKRMLATLKYNTHVVAKF